MGATVHTEIRLTTSAGRVEPRFWAKVARSETGCWNWTGCKNPKGYGMMMIHPRAVLTHRVSWVIHNGPIPDGLLVLHKCDNPSCVRPDHLFLGTNEENMADMAAKGRSADVAGERNPHSKLTREQVEAIRAEYKAAPLCSTGRRKADRTVASLARKYGVSTTQIKVICGLKQWLETAAN